MLAPSASDGVRQCQISSANTDRHWDQCRPAQKLVVMHIPWFGLPSSWRFSFSRLVEAFFQVFRQASTQKSSTPRAASTICLLFLPQLQPFGLRHFHATVLLEALEKRCIGFIRFAVKLHPPEPIPRKTRPRSVKTEKASKR